MMRWIVGSSLKFRRLFVVVAAGVLVLGIAQLGGSSVDTLPEFTPPTVEVQTEALGLSAAEVEQLITVPLEQDLLNGVAFLDEIRSESVPGLSSVEMIFEPGTDLLSARQVVQERLTQAHALPQVSKPPQMLQPLASTSRVMMIGLSSDELSTIDMSILTRWTIAPRLLGVPGVANVAVWGNRERQLQVLVDPQRLSENGVTLQQIVETTANAQFVSPLTFSEASTPGTGGILETVNQRLGIQHKPVFATPDDLARVPIEDVEGVTLLLGDVAEVVEDHQPLIGDAVGPNLLLVVEKFPAANTVEVTRGVEDALEALRPGLSGIEIDSSLYRPATFIETSKGNLTGALLIGALLAILILGAFLFEWRVALISTVTILLSLVAAGLVLSFTQATLNSMIVAGLALALITVVDDAVIDTQNSVRRLRRDVTENGDRSAARTILAAALEMRTAAAYAALITIVAMVPAFFTTGPFGAFFPSVALSYGIAVLASMLVALIVTPALSLLLLSKSSVERGESPIVRWLQPRYHRFLARAVRSPRPALAIAGVVLLVGLAVLPLLNRSTVPSFKDSNLLIHLNAAPGTSLPEMHRVTTFVGDELRSIPGVRDVGSHVGRAVLSDQVVGANAGELWVTLDPNADYDATVASIEEVVDGYPGLDGNVLTYPAERIEQVLSGAEDPVLVRVFGQDLNVLRSKAEEVQQVLSGIDGIVEPHVELPAEEPTLEIQVDLAAAEQHGIKPGDVRRAATTLLSGIQVGSLFEEQKVFEVVVWGTPETRGNLSRVNELLIDTPEGTQVRLGDVADVRIVPSPAVIRHEAVSRYIDVAAGVTGRDLGVVMDDAERGIRELQFPLEYHAALVRDFAEERADDRRAIGFAVAAAIGIFLLLQVSLRSWRLASVAFATLALAVVGGAVAALIDGRTVSLGSIAGFLGVLGIAARHGIVLIRHYQHLEQHEGESFGPELVLRGTMERLQPILATALTTALALGPLLIAGEIAGLEILHPMVVVVLGGLVTSTLLSLFVIPALYLWVGSSREPDMAAVLAEPLIVLTKHEEPELIGGKLDAAP